MQLPYSRRGLVLRLHVHEAASVHDIALCDHSEPLEQPPQLLGLGARRQATDEHFGLLKLDALFLYNVQ